MREELVKFETAKLAKEKGFNIFNIDINLKNNIIINDNDIYIDSKNIDDKYYLYTNEDNCVYSLKVGQFNSVIGSFNSFAKEYMLKETNDYFHAPTQSLLQKWLREKHNIWVYGKPSNYTDGWDFRIYRKGSKCLYTVLKDDYELYEDGLEKGLQEALKLIKWKTENR